MGVKSLSKISLDAAGIVVLADLETAARRTVLTGTSALLDCLVLCPGLHRQQNAPKLNDAESPICAAMTTGYVFRIENPATVAFLQTVGRAGQLTTVSVSPKTQDQSWVTEFLRHFYDWQDVSFLSIVCYLLGATLTVATMSLFVYLQDWWALLAVSILVFARLINVLVFRRRAMEGWKGQPEPNTKSDLIVLMRQDKWIRIQGDVNDVKAVTSGEWLREPTLSENAAVAFATLIVYLDVALAGSGSTEGKLLLLVLLFCSAALLGLCNEATEVFRMFSRSVKVSGPRKSYRRRLLLAEELIEETGRRDWAIKLDMISSSAVSKDKGGDGKVQSSVEGEEQEHQVIKEL